MVCNAAFRCDRDQQAALLGNVVVCGGKACGTGPSRDAAASVLGDEHAFPDWLREEVKALLHRRTPGRRGKVTAPGVAERAVCSWLGGSILGSLGTCQVMWISRREYDKFGSAIMKR